ncbi:MAG TPA: phosphoribosylformylglycinamidine synthase subunit PurS [Thermoanaerobaculia bacterium]|jgi:phosphoribosylformylglycinamidine synthase|nr:phosphoribosylformylglycinamidine synthase subunit PurS [Thermoanaerobaculia bacterium]
MKVEVRVYPKEGVLDPQGRAIASALGRLGHASVEDVRAGKIFFLEVDGTDPAAVEAEARRMAEELLANTVIEGFDVRIPSEP